MAELVRFEEFELDMRRYALRRSGRPLKLERIPMELLLLLVGRRGELVTREEIVEKLWGKDVFLDTDNSINTAIRKIRQVLRDDSEQPRFVQTVPAKGYRFIAPIIEVEPPAVAVKAALSHATPVSALPTGQVVAHYRILQKIGSGGMGVVYEAEDIRLGRHVALKFLSEKVVQAKETLARFMREARALSALHHPNICAIYEIEEHEGRPVIVMELLEGKSLKEVLRDGPLAIDILRGLGSQLADALDAAHSKGIIHRDIEPGNIVVSGLNQAKILDFGLAKFTPGHSVPTEAGEEALTRMGVRPGTTAYMSPEQVRGEELDARSDLFSLGVVLYEAATGKKPFTGKNTELVMNAVLKDAPAPPNKLNPSLSEDIAKAINRALEKDRGLRFQSAAQLRDALQRGEKAALGDSPLVRAGKSKTGGLTIVGALSVLLLVWFGLIGYLSRSASTHALGRADTILLADFVNKSDDAAFDETLREALSVGLAQSPFLNVVPDHEIAETLKQMGRPADTPVTGETALEVCQRAGAKALLAGSITRLGTQYVISIRGVNCRTGSVLAQDQVQTASKENVLRALGEAATQLRQKMGESLPTIREFDVPLEQATTPSLDALKAYSSGMKARNQKGPAEAIPYLKRAIELDPDFALAYGVLSTSYQLLGEDGLGREYAQQAYALRIRTTEREQFALSAYYYAFVTGDRKSALQNCKLWRAAYSQDMVPRMCLFFNTEMIGQYEQAIPFGVDCVAVDRSAGTCYSDLVYAYTAVNKLDDAKAIYEQALASKITYPDLHQYRYIIAFLEGDDAEMARQLAWAASDPENETALLPAESDTEAFFGRFKKSREVASKAIESALRDGQKERAGRLQVEAALREAVVGNAALAAKQSAQAQAYASFEYVNSVAALTEAWAGKSEKAEQIAGVLDKTYPSDTMLHSFWLPTVIAMADLSRHRPEAAIAALAPASSYEMGEHMPLLPAYVRGQAYLSAGDGAKAAAEFQKLIDHRGLIQNSVLGALARLGFARAYALQSRSAQPASNQDAARAKARSAYSDFLKLWQNADAEIPVLRQAKLEYLQLSH
jgi:eukaryotic-like serine/threonine-protein kinase